MAFVHESRAPSDVRFVPRIRAGIENEHERSFMTKVRNAALAVAAAAAMTAPGISMAQSTMDSMTKAMTGPDSGWLVGGSIGQSKAKVDCPAGVSCDDTDTAFRIFGGYDFNKNFGAELGYTDLGKVTVSALGLSGDIKSTAWDLMAVGRLPLGGDKFALYGKLGWYFADTKASGAIGGGSESNNDLTYAIGGQYNFNKNLGIRAEWQQYKSVGGDNSNGDVDVMSIGVVYKFK
jgi:OOP family OmpA-OmpF porin